MTNLHPAAGRNVVVAARQTTAPADDSRSRGRAATVGVLLDRTAALRLLNVRVLLWLLAAIPALVLAEWFVYNSKVRL